MHQIRTPGELGMAIRARRKRLGYTQGELADAAGVGIMYVSQLERGKQTAELGKALTILTFLGLAVFVEEKSVNG